MTFYQELQLNQAGSKNMIRNSETKGEKLCHIFRYLVKIMITMIFCFSFVTVYSIVFGNENSIVGVVVLLSLMVFRNADLGIRTDQSTWLLGAFFLVMTIGSHGANLAGPFAGLLINVAAISFLMMFGCHNPFMFNQSTLVLSYLLLYGYDVSGKSYAMRIAGMALGGILTCIVFYRNHAKQVFKRDMKDVISSFRVESSRSRWQMGAGLCIPLVVFLAEICHMPRAMWAGIAAMSVILPFMDDMKSRILGRIIGNIAGVIVFTILYFLLPKSIYTYIGILGGIGVGFSVKYGWQAVFNTFGALAIAAEAYGLANAVGLRVIQNVFGVVLAFVCCFSLNWWIDRSHVGKMAHGQTV